MKPKLICGYLLAGALPFFGAASLILSGCAGEPVAEGNDAAMARPAAVRTQEARPQVASDSVRLPADLLPARRAVLAAEVAGTVESLKVDVGDVVQPGEVLLTIDRRALQEAVKEAEAVDRQRQLQLTRARNLIARQSITKSQLLEAETNADVATAALARARLQLAKSDLTAPWGGTVAQRRVERGDYVQPGEPLLELVAVAHLKVTAPVAATDVPYVERGAAVTVKVDAFPDTSFAATIRRLGAELDPTSRTLKVEAELDNADRKLKPGMPAHMEIVRRSWPAAILVPAAAVLQMEGGRVVYVVEGGVAHRRQVTVGPLVGAQLVVESGLAAGDQVVVEGQQTISDGQPVSRVTASAGRSS